MLSNIKIGLSLLLIPILIALALGGVPDVRQSAHHVHAAPLDQAPVAALTVTCTGLTCILDASGSTGAVSYRWDCGAFPNCTDTTPRVTFTYAHDSQRTVVVTVTGAGGQTATATRTFNVTSATATPTATATMTSTATPSPSATATATATRTATAVVLPTAPPTSTPTATPSVPMIEGVPVCTGHQPTRWHPLVERNADNSIRCTYGHEHHDNPDTVNDIFGATGAWFGSPQTISYPWQTFAFPNPQPDNYPMPQPGDPATLENAAKHNGYKWYVKRDLPCIPSGPAPYDGCIRAWRVQVHTLGTTADTVVRFHSFSMEAQVDYHGTVGIVRGGGWMNTGFLTLAVDGGTASVCPRIPSDPPNFTCPGGSVGTLREASSINPPAPHTAHGNPGAPANWYADHRGGLSAGPMVEDFGPVDYNNPSAQQFWPPQYRANNSRGDIENMAVVLEQGALAPYRGADNRVNARLWQNRHGEAVTNCTTAGLDCVPFIVEGAAFAHHGMNRNTTGGGPRVFDHTDHDVLSPVTGNSLITYPN